MNERRNYQPEIETPQTKFAKARGQYFDLTGGDFFVLGLPGEKINPIDNPDTPEDERVRLMTELTPRIQDANWDFLQKSMDTALED